MFFTFPINQTQNEEIFIYYRLRRLTESQKNFTQDLVSRLYYNNNKEKTDFSYIKSKSIVSFSPSLDKNYLYLSTIYSMSIYLNTNFLVLCSNEEEVFEMNDILKSIKDGIYDIIIKNRNKKMTVPNQKAEFSNQDNDLIERLFLVKNMKNNEYYKQSIIIPYLSKKSLCINDEVLLKSSSADFNSYCNKAICLSQCKYYNKEKIGLSIEYAFGFGFGNDEKNEGKSNCNNESLIFNDEKITSNPNHLRSNNGYLIEESISNIAFHSNNICPYYYNLAYIKSSSLKQQSNIENNSDEPIRSHIIISTIENLFDFFNFEMNLRNLIDVSKYHVIIDNSEGLDMKFKEMFSVNLKEENLNCVVKEIEVLLLKFQSFEERVKYISQQNKGKNDIKIGKSMNNNMVVVQSSKGYESIFSQDNLIELNPLVKYLVTNEKKSDEITIYYPGNIQNSIYFLNYLMRLVNFLKIKLFPYLNKHSNVSSTASSNSNNTITSVHSSFIIYENLLKDSIDITSIKFIISRLYSLLINENILKEHDFSHFYHLINFSFFLTFMSFSIEKYLFNSFCLFFTEEISKEEDKIINIIEINAINPGRIFDYLTCFDINEFLSNDIILSSKEKFTINEEREDIIRLNSFKSLMLLSNGIYSDKENSDLFMKILINNSKNYNQILNYSLFPDDVSILKQNIEFAYVSPENSKNLTFYSDNLIRLSKAIPDGIICYFSSYSLLEDYVYLWNLNGKDCSVFNSILNNKLIFIEEKNSDSEKNSQLIFSYKQACEEGRGAVLLLSIRNKLCEICRYQLKGCFSRGILFFGFPLETRFNYKFFEVKLSTLNLLYNIKQEEYLYFNTIKLVSDLICGHIEDIFDMKIILFLDEKLICSPESGRFFANWLVSRFEIDENNSYIEERIKKLTI